MDTKIPDSRFSSCSKINLPVTPIHIETGGELGRALLDSYHKHSLEAGEALCYRARGRGLQEWFKYREGEPPELAGPSITDHLISGFLIVLGLGFVSYILSAVGRAASESSSIVPPSSPDGDGEADAEGPTAVPRGVYEVEQDSWKKEGWWKGLDDSEREMMRMVIEQNLRPRLKDREFVEMFVREGKVSKEGIAYLIDSRNGTLRRGRTDMRIGSLRVERRKVERRGRVTDVADVRRTMRRGRK